MEFTIGARIRCADGAMGHVERLVADPRTGEVTHIVVNLADVYAFSVVVPVDRVEEATPESVRLGLTCDELQGQPAFSQLPYRVPEEHEVFPRGAKGDVVIPVAEPVRGVEKENVPEGEVSLGPGTDVYATDGPVGSVHELVVDPDERVRAFIVRRGHLLVTDVEVPMDLVDRVEEDRVVLKISRDQFEDLPRHHHEAA